MQKIRRTNTQKWMNISNKFKHIYTHVPQKNVYKQNIVQKCGFVLPFLLVLGAFWSYDLLFFGRTFAYFGPRPPILHLQRSGAKTLHFTSDLQPFGTSTSHFAAYARGMVDIGPFHATWHSGFLKLKPVSTHGTCTRAAYFCTNTFWLAPHLIPSIWFVVFFPVVVVVVVAGGGGVCTLVVVPIPNGVFETGHSATKKWQAQEWEFATFAAMPARGIPRPGTQTQLANNPPNC